MLFTKIIVSQNVLITGQLHRRTVYSKGTLAYREWSPRSPGQEPPGISKGEALCEAAKLSSNI